MRDILLVPFTVAALVACSGCRTLSAWQKMPDEWWQIERVDGRAYHNPATQRTLVDSNRDGRIDYSREWWGSGLAKEWWDTDQDGWYDLKLQKSYERTREREVVYMRVPKTPHPVRIIDERSDR